MTWKLLDIKQFCLGAQKCKNFVYLGFLKTWLYLVYVLHYCINIIILSFDSLKLSFWNMPNLPWKRCLYYFKPGNKIHWDGHFYKDVLKMGADVLNPFSELMAVMYLHTTRGRIWYFLLIKGHTVPASLNCGLQKISDIDSSNHKSVFPFASVHINKRFGPR